jgi:hypothetical protein
MLKNNDIHPDQEQQMKNSLIAIDFFNMEDAVISRCKYPIAMN